MEFGRSLGRDWVGFGWSLDRVGLGYGQSMGGVWVRFPLISTETRLEIVITQREAGSRNTASGLS